MERNDIILVEVVFTNDGLDQSVHFTASILTPLADIMSKARELLRQTFPSRSCDLADDYEFKSLSKI